MRDRLDRRAAAHNILRSYHGTGGTLTRAPDATIEALLAVLGASEDDGAPAPPRGWPPPPRASRGAACFLPDFLKKGRAWGVTCQLYGLRSHRNWGIGDFEDLSRLGETVASHGADFLGVNPLHALFSGAPERASPFSPSDRAFLNPLYIAVDRMEGFVQEEDGDAARLAALRATRLVDYRAVAEEKLAALRRIYRRTGGNGSGLAEFTEMGGAPLRCHALFEALSIHMAAKGYGAGWLSWPDAFQDPEGAAVVRFAREHAREVAFHIWLQWMADEQLREAAERLRAAGMRIGLYLDLAVGTAPDGAATWSDRKLSVVGAEIGSPPDMFNPKGQKWGLAPVSPETMAERDLRPVRRAYESILRHAGALRIDHAMSLYRLFWIPAGFPATEGAYVLYPMQQILRILADVSQHANAVVVGEDLGVVPEGFRAAMQRASLLGYRVFYFERDERGFVPPEKWPHAALACVGSHDMATLAGWWTGRDIEVRREIGLDDRAAAENALERRSAEKRQAIEALHAYGFRDADREFAPSVAAGIHRLVAGTSSCLMAVQMEDLLGLVEQANIPGTTHEHPNWQRKLPVPIEALDTVPLLPTVIAAIVRERPRRP